MTELNVWDAMTGIGTVSMAITTFIVILQGRRLRKDDDRRHQDGLRPICVLSPYDGVDMRHWRDGVVTIEESSFPNFGIVVVRCALRNVGSGPALNIRLMFRFQDMGGYTTDPCEMAPLGKGEQYGGETQPLRVPVQFRARFNRGDFTQVPGKAWELILVYEDIFGKSFYSIHRKAPLKLNELYQEADTSEIVAALQPWVAIGVGKCPSR